MYLLCLAVCTCAWVCVCVCVYLCNEHVTKLLCSQNSYNSDGNKNKKPRPSL